MALPPTIPTSFVPHPGGNIASRRYRGDLTGAFSFFAYGVLGLVLVLAIGLFFYGRLITSQKNLKDQTLVKAESSINPVTVQKFVHLRDRLASGAQLLDQHVYLSNFFGTLEALLPTTVSFSSLNLTRNGTDAIHLTGTGIAKNFNALASVSTAFAKDDRIKDAIFSHIVINNSGSVSFSLSAVLDSTLTAFVSKTKTTQSSSVATTSSATLVTSTSSASSATTTP